MLLIALLPAALLLGCNSPQDGEAPASSAASPSSQEPAPGTGTPADEAGGAAFVGAAVAAAPLDPAVLQDKAAAPTDPDATLQPGPWVDAVEPIVLVNLCQLEDIDSVGEVMDAGRITLSPGEEGAFTLLRSPEEPESADDEEDEDEEEGGGGASAPQWSGAFPMEHRCTPMAVADRYQCTGGSYSAELAELDATLSFSLTIRATRSDSTVMLLEPSVSVTCEGAGCGSEALGLVAPCTVGTQRGLVYEGPTAGALAVP